MKQCVLEDSYVFLKACSIRSCKLFSYNTESNCLGIDKVLNSNDKNLTDSYIQEYKLFDRDVSIREVSLIRKKAVERVKSIISLYKLICFVRDKDLDKSFKVPRDLDSNSILYRVLERKPLSIKRLGFEIWMLPYILNEDFYKEFCKSKFNIKSTLGLKLKEFTELKNLVINQGDINASQ